ncbi:conserved hypothetical protein [Gammaproteobacteria bacterium]
MTMFIASPVGAVDVDRAVGQLAQVVERCVYRQDTQHLVFHGCIDWHSAVHGHWALLWAAARLGDNGLSQQILARLGEERVGQELAWLRQQDANGSDFEMPYGRAWFLQLARDAERYHRITVLRPMADQIFTTLMEYARHDGGSLTDTRYDNASWYLYQAFQWAKFTRRTEAQMELTLIVKRRLGMAAPWPSLKNVRGFFDPKTMALLLLSVVGTEAGPWQELMALVHEDGLQPVAWPVVTAHQGGLNFSRAWGLMAAARITGERDLLRAWEDHVTLMMTLLPRWSQDYPHFAHWVGQFGLLAFRLPEE